MAKHSLDKAEIVGSSPSTPTRIMTEKEIKKEIKKMRNYARGMSRDDARTFLHRMGMYTRRGRLKRRFR